MAESLEYGIKHRGPVERKIVIPLTEEEEK